MISQLQRLSYETDGRYATDAELAFFDEIVYSFSLRVETYQQLQALERQIVEQVYQKLRSRSPSLFFGETVEISAKWKRDTIRVLRYSAIAMLLNDPDSLQERFLFWMRTIMRAFDAEYTCNVTYRVMQDVVQQTLPFSQARLLCPILELNRQILGAG